MINKVILIGNLGMDPEIRTLETGVKIARLRIATTEKFTTQQGDRKEHTEWHTIVLWRSQADFAEKFLHKGSQIYVEGKIRSRERIDENGTKKTYYEIHAEDIKTLGKREPNPNNNSNYTPSTETGTFGGTYSNQAPSKPKNGSDGMPF